MWQDRGNITRHATKKQLHERRGAPWSGMSSTRRALSPNQRVDSGIATNLLGDGAGRWPRAQNGGVGTHRGCAAAQQ
jgi:hypothetical protein